MPTIGRLHAKQVQSADMFILQQHYFVAFLSKNASPQNQKWDEEETIGIGPKRIDEARRIDEATRTNCFYRYATLFKYGILRSNRDVEDDICRLHLQQGSMKTRCVCTINTFDGYTNEIHQNTTRILAATMC